ncbi:MAG TPA: hypothetical protein VGK74_09065 [Symbiobacteriaceae bacterium]
MADEGNGEPLDEERLTTAKKSLEARVHRNMGMAALVLGLVAAGVALARMRTMFGVSPWAALGMSSSGMFWVLLILGAGVVFSLGTSRIGRGMEWLAGRGKRKKAGE